MKARTFPFLLCALSVFLLPSSTKAGSDSVTIRVHFLHGSKPAPDFKNEEGFWFGGLHGGHVGVEIDSGYIIHFLPSGSFHVVKSFRQRHARFEKWSNNEFYGIFGGEPDSMKKTTLSFRISLKKKHELDSIVRAYLIAPPYDYAFIGIRCAAATDDLLQKAGILSRKSWVQTAWRSFYPKKLRHLLLRKEPVKTEFQAGSSRRIWEN